jgi:hypothetical protein
MAPIRASEIGSYLFCARAWWYQRQGIRSTNQTELTAGSRLHHQHGRKVITAGLMRGLAIFLMMAALIIMASYCTIRIF